MRKFFLLIIAGLFFLGVKAQTNKGIIPGTIKDTTGKAFDGVDLVLKDAKDSTVAVKHTFSDAGGNFQFTNIKDGAYLVSVQLIGFSRANSPVFYLTNGLPSISSVNMIL